MNTLHGLLLDASHAISVLSACSIPASLDKCLEQLIQRVNRHLSRCPSDHPYSPTPPDQETPGCLSQQRSLSHNGGSVELLAAQSDIWDNPSPSKRQGEGPFEEIERLALDLVRHCERMEAHSEDWLLGSLGENQQQQLGEREVKVVCGKISKMIAAINSFMATQEKPQAVQVEDGVSSYRAPAGKSGSARSLLTQKLRQAALEEAAEIEPRRVEPTSDIKKQFGTNYTFMPNRRTGEEGECFSLQPERQPQSMRLFDSAEGVEKRQKVKSHRLILGEIDLQHPQSRERRPRKDSLGCSKCEIY